MNNYERKLYDKYAYSKPYIYLVYEEFERRVNATLEEYEGLKTGECFFDYESWERRLSLTRYKMQSTIKILTNEKYIKKIFQGKKNVGASIFYLCRFDNNQNHNCEDSNINASDGESDNQNNNNNQNNNQNHNISIYNNPNIISNNIYNSSKDEVSSEGSIKANTTQELIKKEIDRKYLEIFEYWNSLKIIKHKECNKEIIKAIDKALKKYDIETIKLAINNYNTLFKDKRHYYKHRWVLKNFLTQGNGISEFLEDGQQYINYQDKLVEYEKEKNKPSSEEEIKIKETDFS